MRSNQDYLDDAVAGIGNGVSRGRRTMSRAMDDMAETMSDWRDQAAPTINRLTDRTVTYVRDEPLRAALMAVAAGTAIYALMRMMRGRDRY